MFTSIPALISISTMSFLPFFAAQCNAVCKRVQNVEVVTNRIEKPLVYFEKLSLGKMSWNLSERADMEL